MEFNKKRLSALMLQLGVILSLSACSNKLFDRRTDQEIVQDRATQRWQLLIKRDFAGAYAFLSPGSRDVTSKEVYIGWFGGATEWLEAVPEAAECKEDQCQVTMMLKYKYRHRYFPKGIVNTRALKETWIRSEGTWWYLLQK